MENGSFGEGLEAEFIEKCLLALHEKDRLSFAGRFVQGFVHNSNGPLQNLSMLTEMLLASMDVQDRLFEANAGESAQWTELMEKQRKRLNQMREQVYGMAANLREFIQLYEIERNGTDIDINGLLSTMLRVFRSDLFFKHHVKQELRLSKNIPMVRIPGREIIPALFHLIQNAMTAMQGAPRKEFTVETGVQDKLVVIRFTDTGCGLCGYQDPETLFQLFESQWPPTDDPSRKTHQGFGLFAARKLLAPHGCTINLECCREGTSAVVRIPLPDKVQNSVLEGKSFLRRIM